MLKGLFFAVIIIMIALLMTVSSFAFMENIVAAWTFDEDSGKVASDVSGNGNDGDIIGGVKQDDGKFGKALSFDGSTGYVEVPFDASMKVLNVGDFTFTAWFMPNAIPAENKEVFQQGDNNGTGRTWLFVSNANEIRSYLGNATTGSGIPVEAGGWYHTAVVVTEGGAADTVQIYVNGMEAGAPTTLSMEDSEGDYFIGCHKDLTNFWDGIIDDVVLFNKALAEDEINRLMNDGIKSVMAVEPIDKLAVCWGSVKGVR